MTQTDENLGEAFAGESQANRRYIFFAAKADTEGYPQIARLFRAAAEAETVHARNHFNAMDGVGSTQANLNAGIIGEHQEFTAVYPKFIDQAKVDQYKRAEVSFDWANKVEEIHHDFFEAVLKVLESGEMMKDEPYFVCQSCGNTVEGEAPDKCSICGAPKSAFKRVD